jgi:hypothetical protein
MKKLVTLVMALLIGLAMAMPAQADVSVWGLGKSGLVGARVGYVFGPNDAIEVGGQSYWFTDDAAPQVFGAYGMYLFRDLVSVPRILPLEFLPETMTASPYLGMQISIGCGDEESRDFIGPVAGVLAWEFLAFEYQYVLYSDNLEDLLGANEHRLFLGFRFQF